MVKRTISKPSRKKQLDDYDDSTKFYLILLYIENVKEELVRSYLNPKTSWGSRFELPPCGVLKNVSSKERMEPWFFVTFHIILRHIPPENFIEFPQVTQKI